MAATERVTVRMSRSDSSTPWGFRLHGGQEYSSPLAIGKVASGSLADRAGMMDGDKVIEIAGMGAMSMKHQNAQDAIMRSGNTLDLVLERLVSRTWKPLAPPIDFPASADTAPPPSAQAPRPFGQPQENYTSSRRVVTESYATGKPSSIADQYTQHTGQYPANPNMAAQAPPPSQGGQPYLQSETLRMIKESESRSPHGTTPQPVPVAQPIAPMSTSGAPACDHCGRVIHGVFCKAGGKTLHGDCFKCATCGGTLKNIGYFLIEGKLYCELHARQKQENQFKANPPVDPNMFYTYAGQQSKRSVEPPKAFYQPAIMKGGPASVEVPPPDSFSPQSRAGDTGYSTNYQYRSTTTTSNQPYSAPPPPSAPARAPAPPPPLALAHAPPLAPAPAHAPPPAPAPAWNRQAPAQAPGKFGGAGGLPAIGPGRQQPAGARIPRRGKGILKQMHETPRIPMCEACHREIRGPFVLAMGKTWCPDHFVCATGQCGRKLLDIGFVEENGLTYCEYCYEKYFAPSCAKCSRSVLGDCLTALGRQWHPECFVCVKCRRPIGNSAFYMENGQPFCESDWSSMFTTKCASCQFAIDPGDRWVEALGSSYHAECFCCSVCQKNLEGQSFFAKGGRPFCKAHA